MLSVCVTPKTGHASTLESLEYSTLGASVHVSKKRALCRETRAPHAQSRVLTVIHEATITALPPAFRRTRSAYECHECALSLMLDCSYILIG